jgi:hypothetical protein
MNTAKMNLIEMITELRDRGFGDNVIADYMKSFVELDKNERKYQQAAKVVERVTSNSNSKYNSNVVENVMINELIPSLHVIDKEEAKYIALSGTLFGQTSKTEYPLPLRNIEGCSQFWFKSGLSTVMNNPAFIKNDCVIMGNETYLLITNTNSKGEKFYQVFKGNFGTKPVGKIEENVVIKKIGNKEIELLIVEEEEENDFLSGLTI